MARASSAGARSTSVRSQERPVSARAASSSMAPVIFLPAMPRRLASRTVLPTTTPAPPALPNLLTDPHVGAAVIDAARLDDELGQVGALGLTGGEPLRQPIGVD